jgi:L-aspartate oxidase
LLIRHRKGAFQLIREKTEVLIIGSGIAGCTAAIAAAESGKKVFLITKMADPMETNTRYAQGGIVVIGEDDTKEILYEDIMRAGDGISSPDAVRIVVNEGPSIVMDFLVDKCGVNFTKTRNGKYHFTQEAAHTKKRILHHLDITGEEIEEKILKKVYNTKNIELFPNLTAIDLITTQHNSRNPLSNYKENLCLGAYALNNASGEVATLLADATIVATGGIGNLYRYTTNPECATGDGICMSYRAGATVTNMEYVQFHPTMFFSAEESGFLISESVRGEGGRLLNKDGEEFMRRYSAEWADLAPRDEVSRAIYNEMTRTESTHVFLDIAHHNDKGINISARFPGIYKECKKHKIDISKEPIPVVPAEHYFCGGILIGEWGNTTITGLYAVGESSCSGIHGANRLASISLLEGLVFGKRAGICASHTPGREQFFSDIMDWVYPLNMSTSNHDPLLIIQDWNNLKSTMWNYVGIVRTETRLTRAKSDLLNLYSRISDYYRDTNLTKGKIELRNGVLVASLIAQFARRNRKTIGCHFRLDET